MEPCIRAHKQCLPRHHRPELAIARLPVSPETLGTAATFPIAPAAIAARPVDMLFGPLRLRLSQA